MFACNFLSRSILLLGGMGLFSGVISGCGSGSVVEPPPLDTRAVCLPNNSRGGVRWTVLIYINAANNLQPDSLTNLAQMASAGSDGNVNIVVQWKQANCNDCGVPSFTGTRRYFIRQHNATEVQQIRAGNTTALDSDRLADPSTNRNGTSDMGDWRVLNDFVRWGSQNYPADHLAVVVWNHGAGWRPTTRSRAVSQDNESGNEIQTEEIPTALSTHSQPIDALIFDASLMQMLEVAYEVRNTAKIMVGSEESPPGAGYPYDQWLSALKSSGKNPCDVGSKIVDNFLATYPNNSNITQSVIDLTKMDNVATKLNDFANALRNNLTSQAAVISNARSNVQRYDYPDNKDLIHFAQLISRNTTNTSVRVAADALIDSLNNPTNGAIIVGKHGLFGQANSNGLAVYIPNPDSYLFSYDNLALSRITFWDDFLKSQPQ